ncbi:MAG: symmetrical bis(5'-nucleosyl)-tetraphosphatase [Pseudomonadota bacterium]|nr:diadenosine tetraphosphatase [Pseudomonadales bacterium]MDY6919624.1 symmetrical bis(5'-nucleosyl)-tetraphosphatase [Pseudomonadota bacterium]
MATYAIGDLQGCFSAFQRLLQQLQFNPDRDQLWLAGDLVNRGPQSLQTLQYCYERRDNLVAVLGNHDLHLLAVLAGAVDGKRKDTFDDILQSPLRDTLAQWLHECPLMHENAEWVLCHAGIYPGWDLHTARQCAREVEQVLQNPTQRHEFFNNMYGNTPAHWDQQLTGPDRWRTITNFFTRMRLIDAAGNMDFNHKDSLENAPEGFSPWFQWHERVPIEKKILFGHWAALEGLTLRRDVIGLDTGCVWGNQLSAYCLETDVWTRHQCG